jgi:branched-chain amino acid aminotransferase
VFLTGTAAEVTPVCEIDGITLQTGKHTLAATLQRAYLATVTGTNTQHLSWLSPTSG